MFLALVLQGGVVALVALLSGLLSSLPWLPVLYGGLVAVLNSGLLVWRWWRGRTQFHCEPRKHMQNFHRSFMERFFVVIVLLAVGFGVGLLEPAFAPLPLLIGFIVGQLSWVIAMAGLKSNNG
jgi:uncharacterized Tic20 family protein